MSAHPEGCGLSRRCRGQDQRRGLGQVAFQKGKFKEAVNHHSRSVRYASKNASFRVNLALAYFKTKSFAQAKKACEAALKIQPSNAKAKRYLKVINRKLKK